jgi:rhodanese-related sulfurtransferase
MADGIKRITGRELKQRLHDGDEIALLDAREEGVFARRHLLMASGVPLSRLELLIDDLVPRRTGANIAIFDRRSYEEYHNNSIPGAISVPGAELVYCFTDMTPSSDTTVIVNCGGRTRSIIGAQSLRNAGFATRSCR